MGDHLNTVVIDFDGTLCRYEFPDVGPPEPDVRKGLLALKAMGYKIHIHSCRTATYWESRSRVRKNHIRVIQDFMEENKLPYDAIIINPNMDKPIAQIYIDDRAIGYRGNWMDVIKQANEMKNL